MANLPRSRSLISRHPDICDGWELRALLSNFLSRHCTNARFQWFQASNRHDDAPTRSSHVPFLSALSISLGSPIQDSIMVVLSNLQITHCKFGAIPQAVSPSFEWDAPLEGLGSMSRLGCRRTTTTAATSRRGLLQNTLAS
jgi:hypothetical protein